MDERKYKTARALEMAVREAARRSGQDVNKAIADYYHDRLLARIFSQPDSSFILKGGRSMLARFVDARRTRDSDLLSRVSDIQEAVAELRRLAAIDLDDYLEYRFVSANPIVEDQDYRDGCRVVFSPVLGGAKKLNDVAIDLVADAAFEGIPDVVTPVNRLLISSLSTYDYLVIPVVYSIADKVCATMQVGKGGRESSRIRDLADLVVYIRSEGFEANALSACITMETKLRRIEPIGSFEVPSSWRTTLSQKYKTAARESGLPDELCRAATAEAFVKRCIDPVLAGTEKGKTWSPSELKWE